MASYTITSKEVKNDHWSFVTHALMTTMTQVWDKAGKDAIKPNEPFEVELKVCGVEVDLKEFFDHMEKEYRRCIQDGIDRKITEIVDHRLQDKLNETTEILTELSKAATDKFRKELGVEVKNEEW